MTHTPSAQQVAFYSWVKTGNGSCVLEAVAGSGKTTTLIEAIKLMSGTIFFGAYNKKIADEIAGKTSKFNLPSLTVSTMHAAGFKAWRKAAPKVMVNNSKCRDIFRSIYDKYSDTFRFEGCVLNLVSYAKQAGFGALINAEDSSEWQKLIDHFGVDTLENDEQAIKVAKQILKLSSKKDTTEIDFDDMILSPLVHNAKFFQFDWVLIDEAQDTNACRRAMALKMLKKNGRLVAVGDQRQAIYGFTGADANSLALIGDAVNATRLPLTTTYRCPKKVVEYAQQWVSHIQAHENNIDGEVETFDGDITTVAKAGDIILCRFNAPTIDVAYKFIRKGIGAKVEGREIGIGLKVLASRWKVRSFDAFFTKLDAYLAKEIEKCQKDEDKQKEAQIVDKVGCLRIIAQRAQSRATSNPVNAINEEIDSLFADGVSDKTVVLLSSIHKSKGREFDNVFWLQTGTSKFASKDWEHQQESNLCYVAATRAKKKLILVEKFDE